MFGFRGAKRGGRTGGNSVLCEAADLLFLFTSLMEITGFHQETSDEKLSEKIDINPALIWLTLR